MELLLESLIIIFNFFISLIQCLEKKRSLGSSKKHSSTFLILDIRSMICNKILNDLAPSIPNFFAIRSSRNRSVPRTRQRDTAETLRLIPESAALPLISSSFSRFSSSSALPQSLPSLFFSSFQFSFFPSFFASSFLLFFSLYLLVS